MAVNYKTYDGSIIGTTSLTNSDTTQTTQLGTIIKGFDASTSAYGEAEFVYAKFTGTVVAGDFVVIDRVAKTATQSPASATNGYYGLAMAAQVSGTYGWVMLRGVHDGANVTTGKTAGTVLSGSGTAGRASSAVANYTLDGVIQRNTAASNIGTVELYYPYCSGR